MTDLRKNRKIAKMVADELGYNVKEYVENEPYLYTQKEMEEQYLENSRVPASRQMYLNVKLMIEDDIMTGYLERIAIDNEEYLANIY